MRSWRCCRLALDVSSGARRTFPLLHYLLQDPGLGAGRFGDRGSPVVVASTMVPSLSFVTTHESLAHIPE